MRIEHQDVGRVVLLAALVLTGCHVRHSFRLTRLERDLQPKLVLDHSAARSGDDVSGTYTVTNVGQDTLELCFGASHRVAVRDQGSLYDIDHPTCASQPVRLRSGESVSARLVVTVPDLASGAATVSGAVEVLDPARCSAVGCPGVFLDVEADAPLRIEK